MHFLCEIGFENSHAEDELGAETDLNESFRGFSRVDRGCWLLG